MWPSCWRSCSWSSPGRGPCPPGTAPPGGGEGWGGAGTYRDLHWAWDYPVHYTGTYTRPKTAPSPIQRLILGTGLPPPLYRDLYWAWDCPLHYTGTIQILILGTGLPPSTIQGLYRDLYWAWDCPSPLYRDYTGTYTRPGTAPLHYTGTIQGLTLGLGLPPSTTHCTMALSPSLWTLVSWLLDRVQTWPPQPHCCSPRTPGRCT